MGNLVPTEVILEGGGPLTRPQRGILEFRAQVSGTVRGMHLWAGDVGFGTYRFGVRRNGVNLFTLAESFLLTNVADPSASKTGLSIPSVLGDLFQLDYLIAGTGARVYKPITFLTVTEETE